MFPHNLQPFEKRPDVSTDDRSPSGGRRPRVTVIGGGTGNYNLLRGLKSYDVDLRVVVAMTDNGGSSGRLRDELGQLPPGDVRQCLIALADDENMLLLRQLFQHRFSTGWGLEGHSVGNILLAALNDITGSMDKAIDAAGRLLNIRGRVLPVTLTSSNLFAVFTDGSRITGEAAIGSRPPTPGVWIDYVGLTPPAYPYGPALKAILDADLIVLAPGDLYTSIIPNLLVDGVANALSRAPGRVALVCNLMTKPAETDGYSASRFVEEIGRYVGRRDRIDYLIVNSEPIPEWVRSRYEREGSTPVAVDTEACQSLVGAIVAGPLVGYGQFIRHDPQKLARVLDALALDALAGAEARDQQSAGGEETGLMRTETDRGPACLP